MHEIERQCATALLGSRAVPSHFSPRLAMSHKATHSAGEATDSPGGALASGVHRIFASRAFLADCFAAVLMAASTGPPS